MQQKVFFITPGQTDIYLSLSPKGENQIEQIGQYLREEIPEEYIKNKKVIVCYAEDEKPNKETAIIISRHLSIIDKNFPTRQLCVNYQWDLQNWLENFLLESKEEIIVIIANPEVIKKITDHSLGQFISGETEIQETHIF